MVFLSPSRVFSVMSRCIGVHAGALTLHLRVGRVGVATDSRCCRGLILYARCICIDISVFLHSDRFCIHGLLCSLVGLGRKAGPPSRSFYGKGGGWRNGRGLARTLGWGSGLGRGGLLHPFLVLPRSHLPSPGAQLLGYQPLVSWPRQSMVVLPRRATWDPPRAPHAWTPF